MNASPYMTLEEVRDYFRLKSTDTVRKWIERGKIPSGPGGAFKGSHNLWLVPRSVVLQLEREMKAGKWSGKEKNHEQKP